MRATRVFLMIAASGVALGSATARAQDAVPPSGAPAPADSGQVSSNLPPCPPGAGADAPRSGDARCTPSDGTAGEAGDIVVTGTRASLENAENAKRAANVVVDGVSADDIGALPDVSLSEAVLRIPGVYANVAGTLSVRGLGPDLAQQEINGRVLPSTQQGTRRVLTGNFPSEGLTAVQVQKTPDGSTIEGGVGGVVAYRTINPLETRRSGLEAIVRGVSNNISAKLSEAEGFANVAPRASATLIKRFGESFGVALTYAWVRQYNAVLRNDGSAWRFSTAPTATVPSQRYDLNGDGRPDTLPTTLGNEINAANDFRNAVLASVQWDIVPSLRMTADGFFNDDEIQNVNRRYFAVNLFQSANGPVVSSTVNAFDTVIALDAPAALYRGVVQTVDGHDKTFGGGINLAFKDNGPFRFKLDGSYYEATKRDVNSNAAYENDAATTALQRLPFAYDVSDPFAPTYTFQQLGVDDYNLTTLAINRNRVSDSIAALRADFSYAPENDAWLRTVDFGTRIDRRRKLSTPSPTNYVFGATNPASPTSAVNIALKPDLDSSFLELATNPLIGNTTITGGPTSAYFPWFDPAKLVALGTDPATPNVLISTPLSSINNYINVQEDTMAFYGQMNFERGLFSGNVGMRYVISDVTVIGPVGNQANLTFQNFNNTYKYLLPSINTLYRITPSLHLRVGISKNISRPQFSALNTSTAFDPIVALNNGRVDVNIGNPNIAPFTSRAIDAGIEWFTPDRHMSIAVQGYAKYVDGYVRAATTNGTLNVNGTILPATFRTQINDPETRSFKGVELIARRDFDFLPGPLQNLGLAFNYSRNFVNAIENVASLNSTFDIMPNNFTKHIVNSQLYYSSSDLDIRLAYRYFSINSQAADSPPELSPAPRWDARPKRRLQSRQERPPAVLADEHLLQGCAPAYSGLSLHRQPDDGVPGAQRRSRDEFRRAHPVLR